MSAVFQRTPHSSERSLVRLSAASISATKSPVVLCATPPAIAAMPGALHVAGDWQEVGRVARKAIIGGNNDNSAMATPAITLLELRTAGSRSSNFLAVLIVNITWP